MAGAAECWVTTGLDEEQCVSALVLAKSLKRVMTLRKLVILLSYSIPKELCEILETEFDVCIRLDAKRTFSNGKEAEIYAKLHCWSLVKWNKLIYLKPHSLVVRNCDVLFDLDGVGFSSDFSMLVITPSLDTWKGLTKVANEDNNMSSDKLVEKLSEKSMLDVKFNRTVDLLNGSLVINLDELTTVSFNGTRPLEILYGNNKKMITGYFEKTLMDLWEKLWENGVVQSIKGLTNIHLNGLTNYSKQYNLQNNPLPINDGLLKDSIAIVGMSCRFPGANNLDEFWKLLIEGKDAMGPIPEGRWVPERCVKVLEDAEKTVGGFLNFPLDEFDGKFFGMSPAELAFMDPQQRLTLQVAWEALEDAGIDPSSINNTFTGVFGGAWRLDYQDILLRAGAPEEEFIRTYLGSSFGALTAKISHCLGLIGPSVGTESGCSSSIVAVDLACKSLARGETDLSLACGVNLLLRPFTGKTMSTILADDGYCKTFDEKADGFARAEGCGVLVLKRYGDAVKDGDRIWGLIRGTGVVQEGASRSLGTPTKYCEALAMKRALKDAKVEPKEVSFLETHGTGTPVGDPLEVAAVAEVYSKGREEPLIIGSVKTNIGHTESCSGIAGIIKVILSLKNEMIPSHKNFNTLNPNINLEAVPAKLPLEAIEWKKDPAGKPRIAGVSSFGITGTDAHAIIQEAPEIEFHFSPKICPQRPSHILALSAKTPEALEQHLNNFRGYLKDTGNKFGDVAHTVNIGRAHFPFRAFIVGNTNSEALENMKNIIKSSSQEDQPKICFLFTGQGSQYAGMAKSLYNYNPIFKINFDICDAHLNKAYGISIREALWGTNTANISRTIYSQTSIFCVEYCLLKLWESWGIKPDFVLGHSLGEFAAAVAAGILSFEDALNLVGERSRLIDGLPGGKMLVLKENYETVINLLEKFFNGTEEWLDVAAVNSPEQTVLAGSEETIRSFSEFCTTKNIKSVILEATHAFHSRHMDPILENYRKIASLVKYSKPTCVYVSGMEGRVMEEESEVNADYWVRHTRESVQFLNASNAILGLGCRLFLEIGPQPVLSAMIMINSDEVSGIEPVRCLPSIRKQEEDWKTILNSVGKLYLNGVKINWKRFDQFENLRTVTAPFYPFQNKVHWYDIPDQGIGQIHPLVGTRVSNASNSKIFVKNLAMKDTNFLKDHVIGTKIIFPGAGFMEMCLLAGHAATQCTETVYFDPTAPITIENFTIESPLGLTENETTTLQVIVTTEDSGETKASIYSKLVLDKETQIWVRHASGFFSPYAVQNKEDETSLTLDKIMDRCREKVMINEMYEQLANFGLKFGPAFQSLKAMWKGDDEVCFEVEVTDNPDKYICHPTVLDSLFQAIMVTLNPNIRKLHVPVSVAKLVWFAKIDTPICFIHCKIVSSDAIAVLYNENGKVLAKMMGATLMETTVGTIMSSLEAQHLSLPPMFENVWKSQMGPMERRANLPECFPQALFEDSFITQLINQFNPLTEQERVFTDKSNQLYAYFMIKCLYDLGWVPEARKTYELNEMITTFKIMKSVEGFLRFMLMELSNDGLFEITNDDWETMCFRLVQAPPTLNEVLASIEKLHMEVYSSSPKEVELVTSTGRHLALFITGKKSALPILFPDNDDGNKPSANSYYMESMLCAKQHQQLRKYFAALLKTCSKSLSHSKAVLRILEVGAGTGSSTKTMLPFLDEYPEGYEFTYTDISQAFFGKGRQIFGNSQVRTLYRILNIEQDFAAQGFIPFHYDLIIANNVIHATQSVTRTIGNLRNLLKDDGMIVISESIKPARNTNLLFGLLDGYWLFKDYELRPYNCEISLEKWDQVLRKNNFDKVAGFKCFDNYFGLITAKANSARKPSLPLDPLPDLTAQKRGTWVVFSEENVTSLFIIEKLKELGNHVVTVIRSHSIYSQSDNFSYSIRPEEESDMTHLFQSITMKSSINGIIFLWGLNYHSSEYSALCKPFLYLCKLLIPISDKPPKVIVITTGVSAIGDSDKSLPVPSLLLGMTKCFQNEKPDSSCKCIDLDTNNPTNDQLNETFSEIFIEDKEIFVAYRDNQRYVSRLSSWKPQNTALSLPKTQRSKLILAPSKSIGDLKFGGMEKASVGDSEIEVRVKVYALNFRDVFVVMKPEAEWDNYNTVGIDFAGVISAVGSKITKHKVGDEVLGCNCNLQGEALASHLVMAEGLVINIPQNMTFNEAATLPAVACTAYLSLIQVAKLTSKDTILIHTASGGVGLVAIQIAKSVGAKIVATAGSKRKRIYLKTLGIQHIFHSRNTDYDREIRKALNGRGVDVVLNSLTSPGFKEASLNVCNEGARFIEMSKLNTWTPEEVKALRPDVKYNIVDLSASTDDEMRDFLGNIESLLDDFTITSIPYVRFDISEIREALNYLQKAKHIGKVVCVMPDIELPAAACSEPVISMFNDRSTYLITGGLGGIGFEVAKWMAQSGAKNIALVGRSAPKDTILKEIGKLNSNGRNIFSLQYDVGDMNQCKQLLEVLKSEERNLPPLRGIMHAAGVLADAVFENQSWEKYQTAYNPKVRGGWNLHQCTLNYPLEHFVMFSSAAACFGSMGQSNHVSANLYLDSLASYRNSIGLPATSVNWGQWGQVGVAANIEIAGLKPFTTLQGITALERIMKTQHVGTCVCEIDFYLMKQVFPGAARYIEDLKQTEEKHTIVSHEQFWADYDSASGTNGRIEAVKNFVRYVIRSLLKLDDTDGLDDNADFQNLGLDSLVMIEMKNVLQSTLGRRATITVNAIKDCHNINSLSVKLTQIISGDALDIALTRKELIGLIREDSQLPMEIQPPSIDNCCKPSKIQTIFMTGATGNLGPYLLKDILQRYLNVKKIYCLVRGHTNQNSQQRLEEILATKGLLSQIPMEKVECIDGSITKSNLGLTQEKYSELSKKVDSIFHLAVSSDLLSSYRRIDGDKNMRAINVLGTVNVLRFAFSTKTKVMFHASSIVANGKLDSNKCMSESWPTPEEFDEMPDLGYPISKFICDLLVGQAAERGLPVKVFRFPVIGGDSETGKNAAIDNNQLMLRLMSYFHLGYMPKVPLPFFILPVDVCSDLSLKVFFDDNTETDVYNVYNPYPNSETEMVDIAQEMGYKLELLDLSEFKKRIRQTEDSVLTHFMKQITAEDNKENQERFFKYSPAIVEAFVADPRKGFYSKKLAKVIPAEYPSSIENTRSVIKRDLVHAKVSGVFEKYGVVRL